MTEFQPTLTERQQAMRFNLSQIDYGPVEQLRGAPAAACCTDFRHASFELFLRNRSGYGAFLRSVRDQEFSEEMLFNSLRNHARTENTFTRKDPARPGVAGVTDLYPSATGSGDTFTQRPVRDDNPFTTRQTQQAQRVNLEQELDIHAATDNRSAQLRAFNPDFRRGVRSADLANNQLTVERAAEHTGETVTTNRISGREQRLRTMDSHLNFAETTEAEGHEPRATAFTKKPTPEERQRQEIEEIQRITREERENKERSRTLHRPSTADNPQTVEQRVDPRQSYLAQLETKEAKDQFTKLVALLEKREYSRRDIALLPDSPAKTAALEYFDRFSKVGA